MPIKACQGCLKDQFLTTVDALDCYTGKQLWVWGANGNGELGDGTAALKSSPVQSVSSVNNWKCVTFATGGNLGNMSGGIKQDGTLWMWGYNPNGGVGDNSRVSRSSPVQTLSGGSNWNSVSIGTHSAAIKTDGTLWLWGLANNGQLGNHSIASASSPVQTVSSGTNWRQVSVSPFHSAAIKTDGTLWLWGFANQGQIGNNSRANQSSPVQTISGGTNWKQVSSGGASTASIKTDGSLWLWGYNLQGHLGANNILNQSSPVQTISAGTSWREVESGGTHTTAIKTDGTLWVWGNGTFGRLGDGVAVNRSSPVQTISGGTNWRTVSAGVFTAAIKTDGTLWTWGVNTFGQLGNNTAISASSPVQTISRGTNWKSVSAGIYSSGAIKEIEF